MIVFLHGSDVYRSRKKLKEIEKHYEKAHQGKMRSFFFDCKDASLEDVQNAIETISLFEDKKLVIVEGALQHTNFVEWLVQEKERLKKSERHIVVIFEAGAVQAKTKNTLYQWLRKNATQQEFLLLSATKIKLWAAKEFERYGFQATSRAQEALARAVGNDLWRLSNEVRKLAAFKGQETSEAIKESDVALLVDSRAEADIFATIDEAAHKNKKQAFSLLYRHLQKGDSPHYLFSMLQYQFRILAEIRDLMDRNVSRGAMAQQTKLHPYVLQKGMRLAEKFSLQELTLVYQKLFRLDWGMKTGRVDAESALTTFLVAL